MESNAAAPYSPLSANLLCFTVRRRACCAIAPNPLNPSTRKPLISVSFVRAFRLPFLWGRTQIPAPPFWQRFVCPGSIRVPWRLLTPAPSSVSRFFVISTLPR